MPYRGGVSRRTYDQFCGLARALDIVGERWTLLLVRDLSLGPQRYTDLLAGLPGIGTSMLAERLRHLEEAGLVRRAQLPPPAAVPAYELTGEGDELARAMLPLAVWGARRLDPATPESTQRPEWLLLGLKARFRADRAAGVRDTYEFRIDGFVMHARVDDGNLDVRRGPAPGRPDLTVTADLATLLALGLGRPVRHAKVDGSKDAAKRCFAIFGAEDT